MARKHALEPPAPDGASAATRYQPNPVWEALHRDFHRALLARCPSRWLRGFCDTLTEEAYRFRQLAAGQSFSQRNEHAEHVAILKPPSLARPSWPCNC